MVRVGIIGAGLIGLATACQLARSGVPVVVWEKEATVARHQSGHNSGVAHAGIYYQPGSAKARNCRRGVELLRAYCADRGLPWDERGKLVVARDEVETQRLREIERRSQANGVPGVRWLDEPDIRALEPGIAGVAALLARSAGFRRLARQNWRASLREMHGSLSRRAFLAEARSYLPWLESGHVVPAPAGVRAQAVDPDGSLVDDFRIHRIGPVTAVRNAPSPAATASLAIAEQIVAELLLSPSTGR